MSKNSLVSLYDVQLFAEGGDGAGSGGEGPAGQDGAALAQPQHKGVKAPPVRTREGGPAEAPAAGEHGADEDRSARFEALIKGEYKDLYDQRVQETIRRRLKGSEENARRLSALSPALELLGQRYGLDAGDAEKLNRAITEELTAREEQAGSEAREAARRESLRQEQTRRQLGDWLCQAEELRAHYPSFDLRTEARDPRFRSLIGSGVPLQTAFEVLHQQEILPAAMAYSARRAEEKLADSVIAGLRRPAEGAMGGQSPVLSRRDVNRLTRADRDEIERRVARGEKIRF